MPKLSINVSCYNVEKYISDCLDSLISQSLEDIEINCIDNGSRDRTIEIIKQYQYQHTNIRLHSNLTNVNLSGSRKNGLLIATSDYVMMIDADDWLEPTACEILYKAITDANVDVVECDCHVVDLAGNLTDMGEPYCRITKGRMQGSEIFSALALNNVGQMTWNKIYRRDQAARAYLYYQGEGIFHKEDVLFTSIFYRLCHSYLGIEDKLYNYRTGTGGSHNIDYEGRLRNAEVGFSIANAYYNMGALGQVETEVIEKKSLRWMNAACPSIVLKHLPEGKQSAYMNAFISSWGGQFLIALLRAKNENAFKIGQTWMKGFLTCLERLPEQVKLDPQHLRHLEATIAENSRLSAALVRMRKLTQISLTEEEK